MGEGALLVCVSVSHGNTARVARSIAKVLHAPVRAPEEVDPASLARYAVVGFGSGIYYMSHHSRLRRYVQQLPRVEGARAFVFSTSGVGRSQSRPGQRSLESLLRDKGYEVIGSFACKGWDTYGPYRLVGGLNKRHPDRRDLARARAFAKGIAEKLPPHQPARRPRAARRGAAPA
jgi:flavodoxin